MRSKILAFLILAIFLVVPGSVYWYYYHIKVSSASFAASEDIDFTVSLQWTLNYAFLPFADKALAFSQKCHTSCTISPIPPVDYSFTITADGKTAISDTLSLSHEKSYNYTFELLQEVKFEKVADFLYDESLPQTLALNANDTFTGSYISLWVLRNKHNFALRNNENTSEIGTITPDKFSPLFTLPFSFVSGRTDLSKNYFILERTSGEQYIVSPIWKNALIFPYPDRIVSLDKQNDVWKVKTEKSVYTYENNTWTENSRFSDYIDISPRYRIWYINESDVKKLNLGNFPSGHSLFLLLDRSNANISIIAKDRNIKGFLYYDWVPAYLNGEWEIYSIVMRN